MADGKARVEIAYFWQNQQESNASKTNKVEKRKI
jgi:hypothetical protein